MKELRNEIMNKNKQNIIIYNTADGKASVLLYAKDGMVWMNQNQLAELFDTSIPNISMHISNILQDNGLLDISVVKDYLTTASDGKKYNITYYPLFPNFKHHRLDDVGTQLDGKFHFEKENIKTSREKI